VTDYSTNDTGRKTAQPTSASNFIPHFPTTNRATRRHCQHQFKKILLRTACVHCGQDAPPEDTTRDAKDAS